MHAAKLLRLAKNWWMVYVRIQIALTTFDFRLCCYTLCFFFAQCSFFPGWCHIIWFTKHVKIANTSGDDDDDGRDDLVWMEKKNKWKTAIKHTTAFVMRHIKFIRDKFCIDWLAKKKNSSFCVKSSPNLSHYSFGVVRFRDNFCFHMPFACIHCALRDLWSSR